MSLDGSSVDWTQPRKKKKISELENMTVETSKLQYK